jgi:YbbR domain-containing protein
VDESSLPNNVQVAQIEPASIRIKLEPNVTKRIRVEAKLEGNVSEGREVYSANVIPGEVEIEGPQSLVDKIDHVFTETVNVRGRDADFQTPVEIEIPRNSFQVKTPGPIELSVVIGEERLQRRFANAPVRWLDKSATGRLLTKTVQLEVFGPKSAVEALSVDDLRVEIITTGLPPDVTSVTPQVQRPANIEIRNIIPREVKVKR